MAEIDCRGYACPIPVVKTEKAMSQNPEERLTVLVDSTAARENVTRLARSRGYEVKIEEQKGDFCLELTPPAK